MNGQKILGYAVAGGILLLVADVAPGIAVGTAALIALAATLQHASQLQAGAKFISQATGGKQ